MDRFAGLFEGLPNWHAALVHFPVALLPLAVVFDLAGLLLRRVRWLERAAATLLVIGAVTAFAAYRAGHEAEESLPKLEPEAHEVLEEHEFLAWCALALFIPVAAVRAAVALRDARQASPRLLPLRWLLLVSAAAGLWVLADTADHGGQLVYRHGVAVTARGPN